MGQRGMYRDKRSINVKTNTNVEGTDHPGSGHTGRDEFSDDRVDRKREWREDSEFQETGGVPQSRPYADQGVSRPRDGGLRISRDTRADIWDRSKGVCFYCGVRLHPIKTFEVDHVLPKALGGTNERSNLVASCIACNRHKGKVLREKLRDAVIRPEDIPANAMTTAQAARRLTVTATTIRTWTEQGLLPALRSTNGRRHYLPSDIDRMRQEMGIDPGNEKRPQDKS